MAAPAVDSLHTGGGTSTAAPTVAGVTGGADQLYLVAVATRAGTNPDVSSISFGELTFEYLEDVTAGDDQFDVHVWWAQGSPSTGTLTVTLNASASTVSVCVARLSGHNPADPFGEVVPVFGVDAATEAITLTSVVDESRHVIFASPRSTTYATNPADAEYTRHGNADYGAGGARINLYCESKAKDPAGADTWNATPSAANDWAGIGVVVQPFVEEEPPTGLHLRALTGVGT